VLQRRHFARRQVAVLAHLQRAIGNRAEAHAFQTDDGMSDRVAHVPDLPGAPLVQRDRHERLILARAQAGVDQPHHGRRGAAALDHHAAPQPLEGALVRHAPHSRAVLALDLLARVQQARRQVPVVGEQQQALRVVVEPAHRIDVLPHLGQQVEDRRPALGVLPRRHVAARLVEQDVAVPGGCAHALAVDADVVAGRIGSRAKFEDGDAVHHDPSGHNQRLRGSPRRDTGGGEDLLKAVAAGVCVHVDCTCRWQARGGRRDSPLAPRL
jgi:hypothetical protein